MSKQLWYYDWTSPKRFGAILEEDLNDNIEKGSMTKSNLSLFDNEQSLIDLQERLREKFAILYAHYHEKKKEVKD